MATARKEVELRITANDLGTKSLDELEQLFRDLTAAQEKYAKSSDAAGRSLRELKQDANDLRAVGQQLASRGAMIDHFEKSAQAAQEAADKVAAVKQKIAEFQATLKTGQDLTKKQASEFANLNKSLQSAEKGFERASARVEQLRGQMSALGLADTDSAKQGIITFATDLGAALQKAEGSIRGYDEALRKKRDAETQAANAAKQIATSQKAAQQVADALGKDYSELAQAAKRGGDGLRAILDPSREAIKTLSGLEAEITAVNAKLNAASKDSKLRNEIKALRSEYLSLANDAAKAATAMADDIGTYKKLDSAVAGLKAQMNDAKDDVQRLSAELAKADGPADELAAALTKAQARLTGLTAQFDREAAALARMRGSLASAGIDTSNLANAENRLQSTARQLATAQDALGASNRKVGQSAEQAGKSLSFFEDNGRKSLSLTQRLRGQILSLTASYVGLFGAIDLVKKTFGAQESIKGFEIKLKVANEGDMRKAAEDMEYVRGQAERLGIDFITLGDSYASFAIAARGAGTSLTDTRVIFESFAEVSKVFRLSAEDTKGVFNALQQIFSKTKVSAEELRGQLGDRLSGALNEFAAALGKTPAEVDKIMTSSEKGISSKFLLLFAQRYREKVGKELPEATRSLSSEINRLKSTIADLMSSTAEGDLEVSLRNLVAEVNGFFRSDEGRKFASDLKDAFVAVFETLKFTIGYFNEISLAVKLLLGLGVAKWALGAAASFTTAAAAGGAFATTLGLLGKTLKGLTLVAGAFFVGYQFGKYLYEQFYIVRAVGNNIIAFVDATARQLPDRWERAWEGVKAVFYRAGAAILRTIVEMTDKIAEKLGGIYEALSKIPGLSSLAEVTSNLYAAGKASVLGFADGYDAKAREAQNRVREANDRIGKEMERFRSLTMSLTEPEKAKPTAVKVGTQTNPDQKTIDDLLKEAGLLGGDGGKKAADAMKALAASLQDDVSKIIEELAEAQIESLDSQMKAVEQKFAVLRAKVQALAKGGLGVTIGDKTYKASDIDALINKYEEVLKVRAKEKFYDDTEKRAQKELTDLVEAHKSRVESINDLVTAGAITRSEGLDRLRAADAQYLEAIKAAAEKTKAVLDSMPRDIFSKLGGERKEADVVQAVTGSQEVSAQTRDKLYAKDIQESQKKINDLLDIRRAKIQLVNNEVELGLKSQFQGQQEVRAINEQYASDIMSTADALRAAIDALPPDVFARMGGDQLKAQLEASLLDLKALRTQSVQLANQLERQFGEGVADSFVTLGKEIAKVVQGGQSLGDAFKNAGRAFLQFASDFLLQIASMIAKQAILNALQQSSASGGFWSTVASAVVGSAHTGAVVGHGGMTPKQANPMWFANAPRFHDGGFPGLRKDEVPAVLLKGEEVLTRNDPRNALNGGGQAEGSGVRIVNILDPELAKDYMESSSGERVMMNFIRRNSGTIKQTLG